MLVGDVTKQASVDEVVRSTRVVIAAAGPYTKLGGPVVDACVRLHSHYLDLSGVISCSHHVLIWALKHQKLASVKPQLGCIIPLAIARQVVVAALVIAAHTSQWKTFLVVLTLWTS